MTYSGTVAGALEGALLGMPGIAVSLRADARRLRLQPRGRGGRHDRGGDASRRPLPPRTFLNINVPTGEPKGLRVTVQAKRNHVTIVRSANDPKGQAVLLD